jgi:hypothetical protein
MVMKPIRKAGLVPKTAITVITAAAALLAVPAMATMASAATMATTHAAARHSSKVSVSASPRVADAGTTVKLSATVKSANPKPTGSVTFWWGNRKLCSAKLSNRSAHCDTSFRTADNYGVRGVYSGDAKHAGATGKVTVVAVKAPSTTTFAVPAAVTTGESVRLIAGVSSHSPLAVTGTVKFTSGSTALCSAKVSKGAASCSGSWKTPGSYHVKASYGGDGAHAPSSRTSGTITVKAPVYGTTTTITSIAPDDLTQGKSATVTVTVASPAGAPPATGTVEVEPTDPTLVMEDPAYACHFTLTAASDGTGTCTITPGGYGFTYYDASYSGDATHSESTYTGKYQVTVKDTTTTAVTFAPADGTVGTADTITATVTNQGMDNISPTAGGTGTVTFAIAGGSTICSDVPLSYTAATGNTATCSYTPTTAGSVMITATYSGDDDNMTSMDTETLTVAAAG